MKTTSLYYYEKMWDTMTVLPAKVAQVKTESDRIRSNQEAYSGYSVRFLDGSTRLVNWHVLGLLHEMESDCNPSRQLFNGQRWDQKTTLVPHGLGPWPSFRASTDEYIQRNPILGTLDSVPKILQFAEKHNGLGYARKDKHSPYLWAGSNHGLGLGYYTADGKYDPNAECKQIGVAPLLLGLVQRLDITLIPYQTKAPHVRELQEYLNRVSKAILGRSFDLKMDGHYGAKTLSALRETFGNLHSEELDAIIKKTL